MADIPEWILLKVSQVIDGVVAQTCKRHLGAPTQEHQLTAKIAQALEMQLNGLQIAGLTIAVQDFPDKGPGSWEKKTGADLYISIVYQTADDDVNKGMLVQSKKGDALPSATKKLDEQQEDMLEHTDSAYVWIYEPLGIAVAPAGSVRRGKVDPQEILTVGELVADGLRCTQGDPGLGRDLDLPIGQSVRSVMEQLSISHALALTFQ